MKAICRKSGITLSVCDDGLPQTVCDIHPIFRLDREQVYKLMQKCPPRAAIQRRLYFLALLSLSDLVEFWNAPFIPSDETIELAFPVLIDVMSLLGSRKVDLPAIRLANDCDIIEVCKLWRRGLHGFGTVAKATEADKMLAIKEGWHRSAPARLAPKHISLALDCLAGLGNSDAYLANAANVLAKQVHEISITRQQYLAELYESLQDCLPMSDNLRNVTFYILRHVQNMIDHCSQLRAELLGNKLRKEEQTIAGVTSFKLVEVSESEAEAIEEAKQAALSKEPTQADFATYGEFIKARAQWRAAKLAAIAR